MCPDVPAQPQVGDDRERQITHAAGKKNPLEPKPPTAEQGQWQEQEHHARRRDQHAWQLLDAVPEMRLCADLSHFVVDRELRLPLSDLNRGYINRVLHRSDCFQGRVASSEQVQVQIDFPQHQRWVEQFKTWWADGISGWRERNSDDATLVFLCELGPPIYAITDAQGMELSDRWQEALQIRQWVEELWTNAAVD